MAPTYHDRKFVIKGVGEGTSEYVLKMFLEYCTKEEITPTVCKKQSIPGAYLVEYRKHEFVDVDTDEFLAKVSASKLEGHRLEGSRLLRTNCLLVSGVVSNASDDEIQFVLESENRTDGGLVTRIDHAKNGNVLVYFSNFADAERIYKRFKKPCKEVIMVAESPVAVELYYHSLSNEHEDIIERKISESVQKVKEELLGASTESHKSRFGNSNSIIVLPERIGGDTKVYKGRCIIRNIDLAIKIMDTCTRSEMEAKLLLNLDHDNIVKVFEVGYYPAMIPQMFIAMELCPENLSDYVEQNKHFDFHKSFNFSKQLVTALVYLHEKQIVHRDLKPWNILISNCGEKLKVTDMGLSRTVEMGKTSTTVTYILAGSNGFKAPETYQINAKYHYSSDIFPLGINIYFIFTSGKHPFGDDPHHWGSNIKKNERADLTQIPILEPKKLNQLITLLENMLKLDGRTRPTAKKVLENEFFKANLKVSIRKEEDCRHEDDIAEDIIEIKVSEPKQKVEEELLGDILNSSEGRAILLKTNCDEKIFDLIKCSKIHLGALKEKFNGMARVELQRTDLDGCVVKFIPKTSRVGYDEKCRKLFNDFVSNFATECKTFDKEKLAKAKSLKLHPLLDSDTDKNKVADVTIKWNHELGSVEVTGLKNRVEAVLQEIENSVEANTVTLPVDEDGYRVMVHCGIIGELSHKHSKSKISCDDEKSQIFITGPDRDISQIQIEALSLMNMAKERKITNLDECAVKYLLQNADRSQMMIQGAISASNIKARFGFDSDELYIKARNSGEHKIAMNIIRDMVALEILPVMGTKADVVKSNAWKQFERQQAKSGNLGLYLKPDNSIVMVGMQADVRVLKTRVDTFLDANEIKRDYIQMEYGYAKFVLERSQEFSALNPVRKAVKCGLTPVQGGGLFTEGIKTGRDSARRTINGIVLKVVHKRHTLRDPGIKSYYVGSEGKEFLETTGRVNNCIILLHSPTCEEWVRYAKQHQHTAVLSGENASAVESSSKNLITVDRSGVHLAVWKTDIIQHRCDVIVNASNKELALLSGGVSGVIKQYDMKNANQIQTEMNAISSQNFGTLMPGDAAITSAGNLPYCKKIVHAVGPRWTDKSERDNKPGLILKSSIRKSLEETEKAKLSSIAIPAISCGVFGGDIKVCVPLILNAVNDYFNDNKASCIKQVDFVELSNTAVLDEFKKGVSKMGTRVQTKSASQPQQQNTQASAALLPSFVKLTQGDIAQENVDVIVNIMAEGHVQDISQGSAVSKAIAAVGGQAVLNECAQHRGKYGAGHVFKTSAGSLTCQEVYHGLVRNFDKSSENMVKRLMKKCLDMAESSRMQSIAFPAIGTGGFSFPPQDVAKWMKDALSRFKFNYITSVLIVLHSSNPAAINAFQVEFTGSVNVPQNIPAPASNAALPQSAVHGPLTVSVIQGDLTKQSCDAIVNSTNSSFNLSQGLVSTKILKEGGDDIQDEIGDATGDFAVTSGGKLPCKNIIHMVTPTGKEDLQKKIVNLLQLADAKGFSSVAIPALGTGKLSMDSGTVGLMMRAAIEAFVKLNPRTNTLNIVHVVIFDPQMLRHFQEAILSDQAAHKSFMQKLVDGVRSLFSFSGTPANDQQVETLDLYLYAGSMPDINQTLKCIENETKKMMHRETIEDPALDRLTAMENFEIEQIEKKNDVKIEFKSGKYLKHLILIGLTKNVMKACDAIRNVLRELSEAETFVQYIAWEKKASNDVWVELPARAAHGLEKAYQEKKNGILTEVQVWEFQYNKIAPQTYDLSTLGANPNGPNPPKIRRKPKEQGAQQDVFPSDWEDMKGTLLKKVRINAGSAEYQNVTTSFQNTGLQLHNAIIERIQSVTLYKQYAAKKAEVTKKLQGTNHQPIERQLFHGTTNADKIISNGFDRSFAGANAVVYGNGVYFATQASYSNGYTRPGANGLRTMFLADVITGAFAQGAGGMRTPPVRSGIDLYDSVVDNIHAPSMYIIFKDASAYPTYLIQYQ